MGLRFLSENTCEGNQGDHNYISKAYLIIVFVYRHDNLMHACERNPFMERRRGREGKQERKRYREKDR